MTRKRRLTPYVFLAPALILLGVFVFYPIAAVIYYSLTDYDIVRPPVFIGLDNFVRLLDDDTLRLALLHSFLYLIVTPILIVLSIGLAIVVLLFIAFILGSLFSALYFLLRDRSGSDRVVKALTVRVLLSVVLFAMLMLGFYFGIITDKL